MNDLDVRTYRARSMQEALALVRRDLGTSAAVLHTREVRGGPWWRLIPGARQIEVTASAGVQVVSRLPQRPPSIERVALSPSGHPPQPAGDRPHPPFRDDLQNQLGELQAMVESLCRRTQPGGLQDMPQALFRLYTELMDVDLSDQLARELVEQVRAGASHEELDDPDALHARLLRLLERELRAAGPIQVTPGKRRLVALVGPTGVGKTTSIAKLAANFRLREKRRVGLITVDTYRIAAVDQLRTYADIIDLPMQVVSTPREMREAVDRMADLDLVLMDTAGRSPRDEVKIQELKAFVTEAQANEVHLVLSSTASAASLSRAAEQFAMVGTTALLLTKLDEATGLGNLLSLVRSSGLPISYLTDGQNVPDDIEAADSQRLARTILDLPPLPGE